MHSTAYTVPDNPAPEHAALELARTCRCRVCIGNYSVEGRSLRACADMALSANLLTVQPDIWDLASDAASAVKATIERKDAT